MSFLGNTPTTQSFTSLTERFNGNGSATTVTLSRAVYNASDIEVIVNNVQQDPYDAYTVNGTNTLTFTEAPSSGTGNIIVTYRNYTISKFVPGENTVTASSIVDGTITGAKITSNTITGDKIAVSQITSNLIAANAITSAAIADGSINTSELAAGAVTGDKIGLTSINANNIVNASITGDKIGLTAITSNLIASAAVTGDKIGLTAINANNIVDGTITNAKLATPGGGSWTYLSTVTASGSATVDIETTIDSTYDTYAIVASNIFPATDNAQPLLRMKTSGSYATGATDYTYVFGQSASGTYSGVSGVAGNAYMILGRQMSTSTVAGDLETMVFVLYLFQPSNTTRAKAVSWSGGQYMGLNANSTLLNGFGVLDKATTVTGVRFYFDTGNVATGTFRLYGIKNS